MDHYVTGKMIKELREKQHLTQAQLAQNIGVSDKTISKWETGKGLPDISLLEPLAKAFHVSLIELLNGIHITNQNKESNWLKSVFAVCPICGNIFCTMGESLISCCGITLPALEADTENSMHPIECQMVEDEWLVSLPHEMSKEHYISFIAYVTGDRCEIVKLYPEQNAEARFFRRGNGLLYAYCNKDGLLQKKI